MASLYAGVTCVLLIVTLLEVGGAQVDHGIAGPVAGGDARLRGWQDSRSRRLLEEEPNEEQQTAEQGNPEQEGPEQSDPKKSTPVQSCLSRSEQHAFWKPAPARSPKLVQLMTEYETFHKKCREQEGDVGHVFLANGTLPCKYLLWKSPYDGLGNRMLSLVSAYLLALLTNRVLVTNRFWRWEELFCEPLPGSSILLDFKVRTDSIEYESLRMTELSDRIAAGLQGDGAQAPYKVFAMVNHEPDMRFFCDTDFQYLDKVPLLTVYANQYLVPGFFFTHLGSRVDELFPDRQIFVQLARYLLNPVDSLWKSIKEHRAKTIAQASRSVGVQVRTFEHPWLPAKSSRLLQCAQERNLLPSFSSQGSSSAPTQTGEEESVACLVASLHSQFYKSLVEVFAANPVVEGKRVSVYQAGAKMEVEQLSDDVQHNQEVVMEIWMLSFCDDILASPGSTFGYVAAGLGGKRAVFLEGLFHNEGDFQQPVCWQGPTSEPCYHSPPMNQQCPSDAPIDSPWDRLKAVAHVCKDFVRGVQLTPAQAAAA